MNRPSSHVSGLVRMMNPPLPLLRQAISKAEAAYGSAIVDDLGKAIDRLNRARA